MAAALWVVGTLLLVIYSGTWALQIAIVLIGLIVRVVGLALLVTIGAIGWLCGVDAGPIEER